MESLAAYEQHGNDGMDEGHQHGGIHPLVPLVILARSAWHLLVHLIIIHVLHISRFGFKNNFVIEFCRYIIDF